MKIGLIQTRGIGDLIIALPIAEYLIDGGHEVIWPIDSRFLYFMRSASPRVIFLPVDHRVVGDNSLDFFMGYPRRILAEHGCAAVFNLYSHLTGVQPASERLSASLKFDEYKYAVCGVPFAEKWKLKVSRNLVRERALFDRLNVTSPYICFHLSGSDCKIDIGSLEDVAQGLRIIQIDSLSDNPFDWIYTLENASRLVMIDSCFSNLVEGLNIPVEKTLVLRSETRFTPVYRNGWRFF
jgi:hypothetical protein